MANPERASRVSNVEHPYSLGKRIAFRAMGAHGLPLTAPVSIHTEGVQALLRSFSVGTGLEAANLLSQGRTTLGGINAAASLGTELLAERRARKLEKAFTHPPKISAIASTVPSSDVPKIAHTEDLVQKIKMFTDPEKLRSRMSRIPEEFSADELFPGSPRTSLSTKMRLGSVTPRRGYAHKYEHKYEVVTSEWYPLSDRASAVRGLSALDFQGAVQHIMDGLMGYVLDRSADTEQLLITRSVEVSIDGHGVCRLKGGWRTELLTPEAGRLQRRMSHGTVWSDISEQHATYMLHQLYMALDKKREVNRG